jgi:hypothetical protein
MQLIDIRLTMAFVWIVGCALFTVQLWYRQGSIQLPTIGWAMFAAFVVRILPSALLPLGAGYEMYVFEQAGEMVFRGESVYLSNIAHPYLPLQIYVFAISAWLADVVGMSFPFWAKLPSIIADTLMTFVIFLSASRLRTPSDAILVSWLYAFNPVVILVSAYQGQFDAIPLLLMVCAWYIFEFSYKRREIASSFVLGFGVLSKTYPAILFPILLLRMKRTAQWALATLALAIVPAVAILIFELLFPNSIQPMVRRALRAGPIPGWWGYSAVINAWVQLTGVGKPFYEIVVLVGRYLALTAALGVIWKTRRSPVLISLQLTILTLFTLIPNLGLQSLTWLIPIGLLTGASELKVYTFGAFIHMIVSYWGLHLTNGLYLLMPAFYADLTIQLSSLTVWIPVIWWWWRELRHQGLFPVHRHL